MLAVQRPRFATRSRALSGAETAVGASFSREPSSQVDPHGYLFWRGGQPFRYIYPPAVDWMRRVLSSPSTQRLVADGALVAAEVVAEVQPDFVLAHPRVRWRSEPHEWTAEMLQDAARLIVRVAQELSKDGLELLDAHPWNVLFRGSKPVFVDWGSVGPPHPHLPWAPLHQFRSVCLNPLHLYAAGQHELAAACLRAQTRGASTDLMLRTLPWAYQWRHPLLAAQLRFYRAVERRAERQPPGRLELSSSPHPHLPRIRSLFFRSLQRDVDRLDVAPRPSRWGSYYDACPSLTRNEQAQKDAQVEQWLRRALPPTVVDIGANAGRYSVMAARAGASVVALEQDEMALAQLYRLARQEDLDILPLRVDLCDPGGGSGWCGTQRAGLFDRVTADGALCLALMHHLVFSRQTTFAQIAQMLAKLARSEALVEWVGLDDPMSLRLRATSPRDFSFYTLENFVAALEQQGFAVELLEPLNDTRRLVQLERVR